MRFNFLCTKCAKTYYRDVTKATKEKRAILKQKSGTKYGICTDCFREEKMQENEIKHREAAEWAEKQGLPPLEGTDGQIFWATIVRKKLFEIVKENKNHSIIQKDLGEIFEAFEKEIKNETSARLLIKTQEGTIESMERYLTYKDILKTRDVVSPNGELWKVKFIDKKPINKVWIQAGYLSWKSCEWNAFCEKIGIGTDYFEKNKPVTYINNCAEKPEDHIANYRHWAKQILSVDKRKKGGFAFLGNFLGIRTKEELPANSLIIEVCKDNATLYRLTEDGKREIMSRNVQKMNEIIDKAAFELATK